MFYGVVHVADGATFWMSQRSPAARVQEAIALPAMMLLQTAKIAAAEAPRAGTGL